MKSTGKRRPTDYLMTEVSPERVARMWGVIEESQQRPTRSRPSWAWAAAGVCAAAACLVMVLHLRPQAALSAAGDVIVTQERSTALHLPDGSSLLLSEAAQLNVVSASAAAVSLHLERGRVTCDVTHVAGRRFTVEALGITVEVKGTKFTVAVGADAQKNKQVAVHVERGVVEVHDRDGQSLATMTPGQSWSSPPSPVASVPAVAVDSAAVPPSATEVPAPSGSSAEPTVPGPAAPALDAGALFEKANAARIAGRAGEAAAEYDRFRMRFPQDARAGLAAFEAGRIRLDSLHDPAHALSALSFALGHNRGGFAAEDAEALRIDALGRLGDSAGCDKARSAFLAAHPQSAHAARVSRACPGE